MIRVMVVDDSALVRRIATDILSADPEITVVATAAQAEFALPKLDKEKPDVITLDLEMPGMGGLEAIRRIMAVRPTPIIVLSAHAQKGAELTLQALDLGAVDFVLKPSSSLSGGINTVAMELTAKVKDAARIVFPPPAAPGPAQGLSSRPPAASAQPAPSQKPVHRDDLRGRYRMRARGHRHLHRGARRAEDRSLDAAGQPPGGRRRGAAHAAGLHEGIRGEARRVLRAVGQGGGGRRRHPARPGPPGARELAHDRVEVRERSPRVRSTRRTP